MSESKHRRVISAANLEAICQVIAATDDGLTGTEIERLLAENKIPDTTPGITKWKRLFNAFGDFQNQKQFSNHIYVFLQKAMDPSRYITRQELFEKRRHELNKALAFIGVKMLENAKFQSIDSAATISEAHTKADKFSYKLELRNTHSEIFKYCKSELFTENYFHAVFEAVKSIADRLRTITHIQEDGQKLVDKVFSVNLALVQINDLITETDRNEHNGLANIIRGLFGMIRNPTAHTPKIKFVIEEDEALEIMTIVSFVHKKLDQAK